MGVFRGSARRGGMVDVPGVLTASYLEAVQELVSLGALVSTGSTRDGGAISITVTYDGDWNRDYCRDEVGALDFLSECSADVKEAASTRLPRSETKPQRRPRARPDAS